MADRFAGARQGLRALRAAVWTIVIVELVLFLYAAYRLDDRAAAFKVCSSRRRWSRSSRPT